MEPSPPQMHELLEDALLRVRDVVDTGVDRSELMQLIASSLRQHYRALAAGSDGAAFTDAMVVASLEIDRAIEIAPATSKDPALLTVRAALVAAAEDARHAATTAPSDLRLPSMEQQWRGALASVDLPVLLDPPRDIAEPALPVRWRAAEPTVDHTSGPEPPRISSLAELDALLDEAPRVPVARQHRPSPVNAPAMSTPVVASEHLATLAETLIEELGVMGLLRRQLEGQTWTGKQRTERRLLARVDAIVSCGAHVLPRLVRKLELRPVPDAELTWGLLYLFGSIAGDDMIDEATRLVRASPIESPEVREAAADAFSLVPNVRIEPRLRTWLRSSSSTERAIAVHALGRRGAMTADEVRVAAGDDELGVVREAALAIAFASGRMDPTAMDRLLHHDDEIVVHRALSGAVLRHDAAGCRRARTLVRAHQGAFAHAALVYALSEGRDALEVLLEDAAVSGSPIVLAALGWFGHLGAVPYLIGRLESDDEATRMSAALALTRLTGAFEKRESFPHGTPQIPAGAHADPKKWRSWWRQRDRRIDAKVRYRFGAPWRASSNILELEHEYSSSSNRVLAHLELVARLGVAAPFDANAFVARQRIQIEAVRERANLSATGASGWPVHMPM